MRRPGRSFLAFLVVLSLGILGACGGDDDDDDSASEDTTEETTEDTTEDTTEETTAETTASAPTIVELKNIRFQPDKVEIKAGGTVKWEWKEELEHNVTADDGSFKSENMKMGSFEHTFPEAGEFKYTCTIHGAPIMAGTVTVS